jgi:dATP pyrophosphohydrolase
MGHVEAGETAVACALRELEEELGLRRDDPALLGVWALEQVHPYYVAVIDCVVLSPRFAAEVRPGWEPRINDEHSAFRWVPADRVGETFMWPGQLAACREIAGDLLRTGSLSAPVLRVL